MNTIKVIGNMESASVYTENGKFRADVEQEHCLIDLGTQTFKFSREDFDELETTLELCRGIWEIEG